MTYYKKPREISVIDIFSGIGGLTHGLYLEGFNVIAGFDADIHCKYAYEENTPGVKFIHKKIQNIEPEEIINLYPKGSISVLVGCAPCQPFSRYSNNNANKDKRWKLVPKFGELAINVKPLIISMENVPDLASYKDGHLYQEFRELLENAGYDVTTYPRVYAPDYGVPQERTRLVMFASLLGPIDLIDSTHKPDEYLTVENTIKKLDALIAGETSSSDRIHKSSNLSEKNLTRIRASKPGGTWEDWEENLIAKCHLKQSGSRYKSVYGRMRWDAPSPTITTQYYGFGNGRFGHPEQDRAISLREGAMLQTFPIDYRFVAPNDPVYFNRLGKQIGNAVPVKLARIIGKSIKKHLHANNLLADRYSIE
jgi:DNA (cytosine-5)-methyltransferase 1